MELEHAYKLIQEILEQHSLISAILSSPQKSIPIQKISIRPLLIKDVLNYQWTEQRQEQAFHANHSSEESLELLQKHLSEFKQIMLFTSTADYQILIGKKRNVTILKKPPSKTSTGLMHNKPKEYLIEEGHPVLFLIELGVMSRDGKVYAQKQDKFRQINRFLEMVDDVLPHLKKSHKIHIVDFGCGKSYLTFALYYYLRVVKKMDLSLTGVDLKASVIDSCMALAKTLGYDDLNFILGDINQFKESSRVDMVVSLHACDTATDAALEKAIRWEAEVILCVPCCQHELYNQVKNESLKPLLKHGILKERFAALATDAARAQILEALGYRVQVLEFVEVEHTPKNLLIRAVKEAKGKVSDQAWKSYLDFKNSLGIDPSLERRFKDEIK